MIKHSLLVLLISLASFHANSQEGHRAFSSRCVYYVPTNTKGSVMPDGHSGCAPCDKKRADEYEAEAAKSRQEQKVREAKLAEAAARRISDHQAEQNDRARRSAVATNEINDIQQQSAQLDKLRRDEAVRQKAINERYDQMVEKGNSDYNAQLASRQEAAGKTIGQSDDAFWNETLAGANYLAFKDPKTNLFGFKDRQGNIKVQPQYTHATDYAEGISFIATKDYFGTISARGDYMTNFKGLHEKASFQTGMKLTGIGYPDKISNGLMVTRFYVDGVRQARFGCVDKTGNTVIAPVFSAIGPFKNGSAIADKFVDEEDNNFEEGVYNFYAYYTFIERGLIDKKGNWLQTPQRVMKYRYNSSSIGYLTVVGPEWKQLTYEEQKAREARAAIEKKKQYDQSMNKLKAEVQRKVSTAQAQGYLIEKTD